VVPSFISTIIAEDTASWVHLNKELIPFASFLSHLTCSQCESRVMLAFSTPSLNHPIKGTSTLDVFSRGPSRCSEPTFLLPRIQATLILHTHGPIDQYAANAGMYCYKVAPTQAPTKVPTMAPVVTTTTTTTGAKSAKGTKSSKRA
jgi:hypothetical protein